MANRHTYISDISAVETWFRQLGKPNWKLLRGFHDKTRGKASIYVQDQEGMDMDEAWELLQNMIEINSSGGGQFTIFVPTSTSGQGQSIFLQIGEVGSTGSPKVAGAPAVGYVPKSEVAELIAKERKMWELERRLEDMEAAAGANAEWTDVIKEKIAEVDLTPVIAGLTQMFARRGVSLQGTQGDYQPPQAEAPADGYQYDGDRLMPILDDIHNHFSTQDEFLAFLEALRDMFVQNPELYKNMVSK